MPRSADLVRHATLLLAVAAALQACSPPALKHPYAVPLQPKSPGAYKTTGRRMTFRTPNFVISAEPLEATDVRKLFSQRAGVDMDPFEVAGTSMTVFSVVVVNTSGDDLSFSPVYATLDADGKFLYHMPPAEAARELEPANPKVDLLRPFSRTLFEASTVVNPHRYVSRLLVFPPLPGEARSAVLSLANIGSGEDMVDVTFPFKVVERDTFTAITTPPLEVPPGAREQKD